jgi:hypothetical protein
VEVLTKLLRGVLAEGGGGQGGAAVGGDVVDAVELHALGHGEGGGGVKGSVLNGTKIRFSGQSDFRSFSAGFCGEGCR